jgi:hypothetical protein
VRPSRPMPKTERADDSTAQQHCSPGTPTWRLRPPRHPWRPCQVLHRLATGGPRGSVPTDAGSAPGNLTRSGPAAGSAPQGASRYGPTP